MPSSGHAFIQTKPDSFDLLSLSSVLPTSAPQQQQQQHSFLPMPMTMPLPNDYGANYVQQPLNYSYSSTAIGQSFPMNGYDNYNYNYDANGNSYSYPTATQTDMIHTEERRSSLVSLEDPQEVLRIQQYGGSPDQYTMTPNSTIHYPIYKGTSEIHNLELPPELELGKDRPQEEYLSQYHAQYHGHQTQLSPPVLKRYLSTNSMRAGSGSAPASRTSSLVDVFENVETVSALPAGPPPPLPAMPPPGVPRSY